MRAHRAEGWFWKIWSCLNQLIWYILNIFQTFGFTYITYMNKILKSSGWVRGVIRLVQGNGILLKVTHFVTLHIFQTTLISNYRSFYKKFLKTKN